MKSFRSFFALAACAVALLAAAPEAGAQTVLTPGTTVVFAPGTSLSTQAVKVYTDVPAQAQTINAVTTAVLPGALVKLEIITSGTTSYAITFGANFTGKGTLQTGTTTAITYALDFFFDGTNFVEMGRQRQGVPTVTVPYTATTSTLPYADGVTLYNFTPTTTENLAIDNVGRAGAVIYLHLIGDASTARTITFTTNIKPNGTLATGSSGSTDSFATFISDGTNWREVSSATGQTP